MTTAPDSPVFPPAADATGLVGTLRSFFTFSAFTGCTFLLRLSQPAVSFGEAKHAKATLASELI